MAQELGGESPSAGGRLGRLAPLGGQCGRGRLWSPAWSPGCLGSCAGGQGRRRRGWGERAPTSNRCLSPQGSSGGGVGMGDADALCPEMLPQALPWGYGLAGQQGTATVWGRPRGAGTENRPGTISASHKIIKVDTPDICLRAGDRALDGFSVQALRTWDWTPKASASQPWGGPALSKAFRPLGSHPTLGARPGVWALSW